MGRIRLTGNYTDGKLRSVTFSKGQGQVTIPVGASEHKTTDAEQDEPKQAPVRKSSLAAFLADEKRKGR